MTWLTNQWAGISDADRATWIDSRNPNPLSPYHVFLKENVNRFKNLPNSLEDPDTLDNWSGQSYPVGRTGTCSNIWSVSYTPGPGYVDFQRTSGVLNDQWGNAFFILKPTTERPAYKNLIHIETSEATGVITSRIENLDPGLTRIRWSPFTVDGQTKGYWSQFDVTIL